MLLVVLPCSFSCRLLITKTNYPLKKKKKKGKQKIKRSKKENKHSRLINMFKTILKKCTSPCQMICFLIAPLAGLRIQIQNKKLINKLKDSPPTKVIPTPSGTSLIRIHYKAKEFN